MTKFYETVKCIICLENLADVWCGHVRDYRSDKIILAGFCTSCYYNLEPMAIIDAKRLGSLDRAASQPQFVGFMGWWIKPMGCAQYTAKEIL